MPQLARRLGLPVKSSNRSATTARLIASAASIAARKRGARRADAQGKSAPHKEQV